jgi:hypothetical protein
VAQVEPLSHFPEEREFLLSAYTPVQYQSQRLEYLEIGFTEPKIKLVMIVTYKILGSKTTFEEFESTGQDLKSAVIICMPARTAFKIRRRDDEIQQLSSSVDNSSSDERKRKNDMLRKRQRETLKLREIETKRGVNDLGDLYLYYY